MVHWSIGKVGHLPSLPSISKGWKKKMESIFSCSTLSPHHVSTLRRGRTHRSRRSELLTSCWSIPIRGWRRRRRRWLESRPLTPWSGWSRRTRASSWWTIRPTSWTLTSSSAVCFASRCSSTAKHWAEIGPKVFSTASFCEEKESCEIHSIF